MRTIMVMALTANLLLSAGANYLEVAIAGQSGAVSVSPASLMAGTADLPAQEYPGF